MLNLETLKKTMLLGTMCIPLINKLRKENNAKNIQFVIVLFNLSRVGHLFFVSIVRNIRNNIVDPTMRKTTVMNLLIKNFNHNLGMVMSKLVNPLY